MPGSHPPRRITRRIIADIPKNVLDTLDIYMVDTMDEVLKIALGRTRCLSDRRHGRARRAIAARPFRDDSYHYALQAVTVPPEAAEAHAGVLATLAWLPPLREEHLKVIQTEFVTSAGAVARQTSLAQTAFAGRRFASGP